MIGKLEEAYRHQCSCRIRNQQKVSLRALGKRSKPQAKIGRRQSASIIAQQLSTATGRQVSRFYCGRRLHKGDLLAHRPERCLLLKVDHRLHRLQWCKEHKKLDNCQWSRVLFTDESRFSTRSVLNAFWFGER
ncbi:transposable element Tcb2 transposase [Trichonephila clavipes]|nr:transposable element Tcb2 transposase [Trichonephila clavipes]